MKYKENLPLMGHQEKTVQKILDKQRVFVGSDPGTGKTISVLAAWNRGKDTGRLLVVCPKSIMQAAWAEDIKKFLPEASYAIAAAGKKRQAAFDSGADIVITNHDAVKWIKENGKVLEGFNFIAVDESTAFKNKNSQRSKALNTIRKRFDWRVAMSGTFAPQTVLDVWNQMFFVDDGETLGKSLFHFKQQVCTPEPVPGVPGATIWRDKDGAHELVAAMIQPRSVRFSRDECLDLPDNIIRTVPYELSPKHRKMYDKFKAEMLLELEKGDVTAQHAGVLANKLLQLTSGAVYGDGDVAHVLDTGRTELIMDLVQERNHTLVAFNWTHQKEQLIAEAEKRKLRYAVIDGTVSDTKRAKAVEQFQAGLLNVLFAHPQSAGHGLTLTKGEAAIWASPTFNAELFEQFNARIWRKGQTKKVETLLVTAKDTYEEQAYERLLGKVGRMNTLLDTLNLLREAK